MLYIYCVYSVFNWSSVVFDCFSLDIVFTLFVIVYSKESFLTNRNITIFKKYLFDKIFFDICMIKVYKVHIYVHIYMSTYAHVYICMYLYICRYINVCIHIIYIYIMHVYKGISDFHIQTQTSNQREYISTSVAYP